MTLRVFILLSALPALAFVPVPTVKTDPARVSMMHEQLRSLGTSSRPSPRRCRATGSSCQPASCC